MSFADGAYVPIQEEYKAFVTGLSQEKTPQDFVSSEMQMRFGNVHTDLTSSSLLDELDSFFIAPTPVITVPPQPSVAPPASVLPSLLDEIDTLLVPVEEEAPLSPMAGRTAGLLLGEDGEIQQIVNPIDNAEFIQRLNTPDSETRLRGKSVLTPLSKFPIIEVRKHPNPKKPSLIPHPTLVLALPLSVSSYFSPEPEPYSDWQLGCRGPG